ncbi:hypothetical protein BDY21DRAFT_357261 [Lineolata rhizophorae]|uniref:PD-(D/E)XK nuclease-like domain-containing protein n=1 Tax=Lineolata rhizophorae TaxID=578093 RepID=A0A6A6NNX7_9PEZI|nr:hypothetical protein BDY21DRAFT_357261 [Lineolata rhizophorae]
MRSAVISAWQHDVAASAAAYSGSTPPPTGRKRPHLSEPSETSSNQQSLKRRRVALSSIAINPRNVSAHTKDRSPSKRTRAPSPRKRGNNGSDVATKELGTPRTRSQPPIPRFDPQSSYREALAADSDESEIPQPRSPSRPAQTESDAPSTSKRSTSPVKRVAALQDVGSGIFYRELSDNGTELGTEGQELFWLLQDSSLGIAALPAALEPELLPEQGRIRPFQIDTTDLRSRDELLAELETVREINRASRRCVRDSESEPEWNNSVHGTLLRLALRKEDRAGFRYITTARIDPQYVPAHSSGLGMLSKMVDYAIYLETSGPSSFDLSTSSPLHERISALITDVTHSINHTSYVSLRHRPIAVSIETKTIGRPEEEARVQLAIWVAAQFERIRSLFTETAYPASIPAPTKASRRKNPKALSEELDRNAVLGRIVFPLLYVQSVQWTVLFARPSPSPLADRSVTIFSSIILGETSSLLGAYRILRGLRVLEQWIDTTYRNWWKELLDVTE